MPIALSAEWKSFLGSKLDPSWYDDLLARVHTEYSNHTIYPPANEVFAALNVCKPADTKVILLGQDPYHGPGQAHGLAFSVPPGITPPPSLKNIFIELAADTGVASQSTGDLRSWARQGVLLLNSTLTVRAGTPLSHRHLGWNRLTDTILEQLSTQREHLVFILWGKEAAKKAVFLDTQKHCVLTAPHPSPLSAYRGFFGCNHFTATNQYLQEHGLIPITW